MRSVTNTADIPYERQDLVPEEPFDFDGTPVNTLKQYVVPLLKTSSLWIATNGEKPWTIDPNIDDEQWSPSEARRIAAALLEAADWTERLNGEA